MEQREEDLVRQHAEHDAELREIYSRHLQLKHELEAFRGKLHLSNEEEMEKKRIQKLKLASKDRLMEILARYR